MTSLAKTFSSMRSQALNRKLSAWPQNPAGFAVAGRAIGKEHDAELAADEIERGVLEWQRLRIRLLPDDAAVRALS